MRNARSPPVAIFHLAQIFEWYTETRDLSQIQIRSISWCKLHLIVVKTVIKIIKMMMVDRFIDRVFIGPTKYRLVQNMEFFMEKLWLNNTEMGVGDDKSTVIRYMCMLHVLIYSIYNYNWSCHLSIIFPVCFQLGDSFKI